MTRSFYKGDTDLILISSLVMIAGLWEFYNGVKHRRSYRIILGLMFMILEVLYLLGSVGGV